MTDTMEIGDKRVVWTEIRLEKVQAMWAEGATASEIASEIGADITRNMVCGLVHRRGFIRAGIILKAAKEPKPAKQATGRIHVERPAAPLPVCDHVEAESLHLTIDQLEDHHCRWPELDGPEQTYCGLRVKLDRPYCPNHSGLAFVPPPVRKDRILNSELARSRGGIFGKGRSA